MAQGEFAYAMNGNRFLAAPALRDQPFALFGVPFDGAVTNRPGARFGPAEIRRASLMLCDGIHPHFDVSPAGQLGDALDLRLPNASALVEVRRLIEMQAGALMARHHCVALGGDHSITLPLLRAAHRVHGPLALGMDCVEVAPAYDHAELTSQAAAAFVWTYLCAQVAKRASIEH